MQAKQFCVLPRAESRPQDWRQYNAFITPTPVASAAFSSKEVVCCC